jgi:hypothetical protein
MHFKTILIALALCLFACAQDALAQTTADSTAPRLQRENMIGLNMTNTLFTLLGGNLGDLPRDPYLLTIRAGNIKHRFRAGLNFTVNNNSAENPGTDRSIRDRSFNMRIGYENAILLDRRFIFYSGFDAVFNHRSEIVTTTVNGFGDVELTNRTNGVGAGPVIGLMWRVHKHILLSTESNLYLIYNRGEEKEVLPPDVNQTITNKEFNFSTNLPVSLFVNVSF